MPKKLVMIALCPILEDVADAEEAIPAVDQRTSAAVCVNGDGAGGKGVENPAHSLSELAALAGNGLAAGVDDANIKFTAASSIGEVNCGEVIAEGLCEGRVDEGVAGSAPSETPSGNDSTLSQCEARTWAASVYLLPSKAPATGVCVGAGEENTESHASVDGSSLHCSDACASVRGRLRPYVCVAIADGNWDACVTCCAFTSISTPHRCYRAAI